MNEYISITTSPSLCPDEYFRWLKRMQYNKLLYKQIFG